MLISGFFDANIKLWNITTGSLIRTLSNHTLWLAWAIDISRDGQTLVSVIILIKRSNYGKEKSILEKSF